MDAPQVGFIIGDFGRPNAARPARSRLSRGHLRNAGIAREQEQDVVFLEGLTMVGSRAAVRQPNCGLRRIPSQLSATSDVASRPRCLYGRGFGVSGRERDRRWERPALRGHWKG